MTPDKIKPDLKHLPPLVRSLLKPSNVRLSHFELLWPRSLSLSLVPCSHEHNKYYNDRVCAVDLAVEKREQSAIQHHDVSGEMLHQSL